VKEAHFKPITIAMLEEHPLKKFLSVILLAVSFLTLALSGPL
jgi:hypothetical protein